MAFASQAAAKQCAETIPLAKIIAKTGVYHGKTLWIVGHATIEFENMTVCPLEDSDQFKECLWLSIDDGPFETEADHARYRARLKAWEAFSYQTVALRATFDKNERGHFGMWPGGLGKVVEVMGHDGGWDFAAGAARPRNACAAVYRLPKLADDRRAMIAGNRKLRAGDVDGAVADFGRAIAIAPDNGGYYLIRANANERKRDYAGAVADYTRALELAREDKDVILGLRAAARERAGDLDGAIEDYGRAIEINPKDAESFHRRGAVRQKKGDARGAAADFAKAMELDPKIPAR